MTELRSRLNEFWRRQSSRRHIEWADDSVGATLLRELADSILTSGDAASWRRRPSISHDGMPVILSSKIQRRRDDAIRLLVEPGSYATTVAQQVAFSLMRLDRLLGLLDWRSAVTDINAITTALFPSDPAGTVDWWGGIWFGANVPLSAAGPASDADLRLYLNMRHGAADARWRTLLTLIAAFVSPCFRPFVYRWWAAVSRQAIPVGLGAVVARGQLSALRAYVGIYDPTPESLSMSIVAFTSDAPRELTTIHRSFTSRFGPLQPQAVTIGYDFVRDTGKAQTLTPGRVKVDFCCHVLAPEQREAMAPWIDELLATSSLDSGSLTDFNDDLDAIWDRSEVQFLSLGFTPSLDHVTVYVKPGT